MIVGGYSMHLYCRFSPVGDQSVQHPWETSSEEFADVNLAGCMRQARRRKWRFDKDGDVTCAHCIMVEKK